MRHDLEPLHEAIASGLRRGALIHEKTGVTRPVEVLVAEGERLVAVARIGEGCLDVFEPPARVRVELPRETSVVYVPGQVTELRREPGGAVMEISCPKGAENRQRRMDVRLDSECRIRLRGEGEWEETRTVNLSAGGALVVSETRARVGEVVEVELDFEGRVLCCSAEVVRRGVKANGAPSRTSAAFRFLGLSDDDRERVALFVLRAQASEKLGHRR